MPFHLMGGKSVRWSLPLPLRADATTGVHRVRFDFEIKGRQVYRFSLYRDVHLGSDDIELQFSVSRLSDDEVRLLVDVMNNTESAMSFDCKLLSPHVPYQRFQLLDLPPGSSQRELRLRIPPSAQPVTHWIRCERIRDTRTMNYRVTFQ
ncbi:MAG: hypothetical protein KatS3mg111_1329 [Pirellulaceae bacterium]|nr:MAG: hypothetical protein KatS3mg111_1329 [Pirellulaceae bacterium]